MSTIDDSGGLLLDTCTFLWMLRTPSELSTAALEALIDPAVPVYLSVVSQMTPVGFKPRQRRYRRH